MRSWIRFITVSLLGLYVVVAQQPPDAQSVGTRPPASLEDDAQNPSRHPLAALVGPHYEHHWAYLPSFYVGEGMRKCFHEFVPADINIAVPYYGNKTDQGYPCHISISDSDGMTMAHSVMTHLNPVGLLHHKSQMSQQYKVCIACGKSSWMARTQAEIGIKIELLTEMNDVLNLINEAEADPTKPKRKSRKDMTSYQVINNYLQEAHKELEVTIELEFQELMKQTGDFATIESMKWRIRFMSLITLACTGLTMFAVVRYLRRFFRREKVI